MSMSDCIGAAKQKIAAKAVSDSAFRERLIANPQGTIEQEFGLPDGMLKNVTINIVEDQSNVYTISIPPSDDEALSDEQLESVAGGFDAHRPDYDDDDYVW